MMIQISGDYGDPKADSLFWPLQKSLNDSFKKNLTGVYFKTLVLLSIVFRVSGKVHDFGSDGPERLKHNKKDSEITIDLVFPETSWRSVEKNIVKSDVVRGVQECIRIMLDKAKVIDEVNDTMAFDCDVEKAISDFLKD